MSIVNSKYISIRTQFMAYKNQYAVYCIIKINNIYTCVCQEKIIHVKMFHNIFSRLIKILFQIFNLFVGDPIKIIHDP